MQRFAQETPLQLAPVEVKPLLEGALHLSRLDKLHNLRVHLEAETACPPGWPIPANAHVFLQIISNAIDAMEEVGGGELSISVRAANRKCAFSSPIPARVPASGTRIRTLYTTKPVGKERALD